MRKVIACLVLVAGCAFTLWGADGPLTNGANIRVRTDANGYVLAAAQTYTGPDGPLRTFANTLVRTDANGYLILTNPSGFGGAPTGAQYWVGAADATLTAEKNLGALSTALVVNTAGVPSAYAGVTCTTPTFLSALSAVGASTCASTTEFTTTSTGNIDDLDFSNANLIRLNNASAATIRGLVAGTAGQTVTIASVGAGNVFLAHQSASDGTAGNRLINAVTSGSTPLAAGVGAAVYQYDGTTARWRLIAHEQGAVIANTYNAGDFTGSGSQTWTVQVGDVTASNYLVRGRTLYVNLAIDNASVGGTPSTQLRAVLPGGFSALSAFTLTGQAMQALDNNNSVVGIVSNRTTTELTFAILAGGNWTASTNANAVYFNGLIPIS